MCTSSFFAYHAYRGNHVCLPLSCIHHRRYDDILPGDFLSADYPCHIHLFNKRIQFIQARLNHGETTVTNFKFLFFIITDENLHWIHGENLHHTYPWMWQILKKIKFNKPNLSN